LEEGGFLLDKRNDTAVQSWVKLTEDVTVDLDVACGRIIKALQHGDNSRLATARGTDDCRKLTLFDLRGSAETTPALFGCLTSRSTPRSTTASGRSGYENLILSNTTGPPDFGALLRLWSVSRTVGCSSESQKM
jgi:hypothetical protein